MNNTTVRNRLSSTFLYAMAGFFGSIIAIAVLLGVMSSLSGSTKAMASLVLFALAWLSAGVALGTYRAIRMLAGSDGTLDA